MHAVVELASYLRKAEKLLSEEDRDEIVSTLALNPESGALITGTGGFRKVRFGIEGRGKSGGARVIYFLYNETMPLYLVAVYAKNEKANLTAAEKKDLKKIAEELKR